MVTTRRQVLGEWGEDQAALFLKRHGYCIIERNFYTKYGEIDIIARLGEALCFIEVKTRTGWQGSAERATGYEKMAHMERAARAYCHQHTILTSDTPIMFEHVSLYVARKERTATFVKYRLDLTRRYGRRNYY